MLIHNFTNYRRAVAAAVLLAGGASVHADNTFFAHGDLVLFFQELDSSGKTLYVSLGSAAQNFRGAATGAAGMANAVDIANLGAQLESTFGIGWQERDDLYAGLAGCWSNNATTSSLLDGDPARTLYISQPRDSAGTLGQPGSNVLGLNTNNGMTTAAGAVLQMNLVFDDASGTNGFNSAVLEMVKSVSSIDDQNPFLTVGSITIQDTAFQTFAGGVQQQGAAGNRGAYGPVAATEFALDLYRIQARNNIAGQVGNGETVRAGTLEGTVVVDSTGKVSFLTSSGTALSNYDVWANDNSLVGADRAGDADPDKDGIRNGVEFVIGGNPKVAAEAGMLPTPEQSGNNLVFRFRRTDASAYLNPSVVYSDTLNGFWTPAVHGIAGVVVTEEDDYHGTGVDRVSVTIPAVNGRQFARLLVTVPQ